MALITRGTSDGYIIQGAPAVTVDSSTETTLVSANIQGGTMGDYKCLEFLLRGRITTPLLLAPTGTLRVKLGSTTFTALNGLSLTIALTTQSFLLTGRITNNLPNVQDVGVEARQLTAALQMNATAWAVDTTVDQTFALSWQFGALNLGISTLIADWFSLEVK